MGYNTTVVVMNAALDCIEKDAQFGPKLAAAIREAESAPGHRVDIASGGHVNAAHVVEVHHSNHTVLVTVGGNVGLQRVSVYDWRNTEEPNEMQTNLLAKWADKLGFALVPKIQGIQS